MNLVTIHHSRRLSYNLFNGINCILREYSNTRDNKNKNECKPLKSVKFKGYNVIYTFPYVIYALGLNKLKRYITFCCIANIPIVATLQIINTVSLSHGLSALGAGTLFGVTMHIGCYMCNNLVGSICFKEDDDKVIISYINYWGKRIDLIKDNSDIMAFSELPPNSGHKLYRYFIVQPCNNKLKLFVKHGKIIDKSSFQKVLGSLD